MPSKCLTMYHRVRILPLIMSKLGIIVTDSGIIIVARNIPKMRSLPLNSIRPNAYPAKIEVIRSPVRVPSVIRTLFMKYFEKLACSQASTKLTHWGISGSNFLLIVSPNVINEVEIIQKNGNMLISALKINIK